MNSLHKARVVPTVSADRRTRRTEKVRAAVTRASVRSAYCAVQDLDTLWGVDYAAESNVVDRHVRNLRARLKNDWRHPRYIQTVPGRGYRFLPSYTDSSESEVPQAVSASSPPATSST